jgi:murein DD-endopeptidase MepM/ murein hydrolase activator NlpD/SH3-like domain-containing protein
VLVLFSSGCRALEQVQDRLFDHRTPRERYEASLAAAGLDHTALARDWTEAAERALHAAPVVTSPHVEEGYLPPGEPAALALRITARRGQEVVFESELVGDSTTLLFVEAWRVESDSAERFHQVAVADSGERLLRFEPRDDADYVVRVQPELLRGGRVRVSLRIGPTLAFPILDGNERAVRSTFGVPRDGGAREHHGIDIFAPRGTVAVAAAQARVARVENTPRGGNVVWLRDERGYALYYAHLDRQHVTEGDEVQPGDTIGFVGNTGNAVTTPPHLHFGVYRRGEGPMDPWWFVHRPAGVAPRLVADTALLGRWTRTSAGEVALRAGPDARVPPAQTLARHTVMRVLAAVGTWYRVRLPDGTTGYLAARLLEPARAAVETTELALGEPVRSRPGGTDPSTVIEEVTTGDAVPVLGRFGDYLLVRTPAGRSGWVAK